MKTYIVAYAEELGDFYLVAPKIFHCEVDCAEVE